MSDLRIERYDHCDWSKAMAFAELIGSHDEEATGEQTHRPFSVFLYDGDGSTVGGAAGSTSWGLCEVTALAVQKRFRGQGWGRKLMQAVEQTARERHCANIHLHTMNFQAIGFYRKVGFVVQAELSDESGKYTRYFLAKTVAYTEPSVAR
jgi:ribosomal protein S18 acetylase RimI-like enzyme